MTKETLIIGDIQLQLQGFLSTVNTMERKPVAIGQAMEEVNELVRIALNFLENQAIRTYDDAILLRDIADQKSRFMTFSEKYQLLMHSNQDFDLRKAEADAIESKHNELEKRIREVQKILDNHTDRYKDLTANFEDLTTRMEYWRKLLNEIESKYRQNLNTYNLHLSANDELLRGILKYSGNPQDHVEAIANNIKAKLREFDGLLVKLIQQRNDLQIQQLEEHWNKLAE